MWRTGKARKCRLGVVNRWRSKNFCLHGLLGLKFLSLVGRTSLPPGQGGYLSHGRFISCLQGNRGGSECPSCTGCPNFNLEQSIRHRGMIWAALSWVPSPTERCVMRMLDVRSLKTRLLLNVSLQLTASRGLASPGVRQPGWEWGKLFCTVILLASGYRADTPQVAPGSHWPKRLSPFSTLCPELLCDKNQITSPLCVYIFNEGIVTSTSKNNFVDAMRFSIWTSFVNSKILLYFNN